MRRFRVGVDSGTIQIAKNPGHLEKGSELYAKIQDLALWTARAVWDGRKGAIASTHGDDLYTVEYEHRESRDWKEMDAYPSQAFLVNLPEGELGKPFTLYVGDVGRVDGALDIPPHNTVEFVWIDESTLRFISYAT